ncbi:relaxase/mobilization nuclease domain-containing protein [Hassallia byssoidea VB512170]|uniref:Relaxase/mobilization nuclease domain-containing protein n=1 Tax=Hassallia byssoidea VB512170 TaxID=1304833 RepID=A0A846H568_9CYAN|nr:relaxase/mobilization nuclease domain-containing protein [Hassalia byssoidea]NEU71759.1 relaxase/mobilization nuclease domain-containing protein [Hassalia byssoidea VB512170]
MIPVIYKKSDFLDTLKYVLGKEDAAIVDTNMMGTSPHFFNEQFLSTKYTNKAVKRQCAHLIISIAHRPDYHEHLSNSQYSYVAREFLRDMGYLPKDEASHATSQFVAVRHHDRSHEHLHIIASRIRLDGSLVDDSYDYFNSQVSTRRIAAQLGLEVTPTTNEAVASRLKQEYEITVPTSPKRSKSIRAINSKHKTPTSKEIIREAIGDAIKDSPTISTFIQRLEENNIGVLPKMRGDELLGFTYIHNDVKIAGYQVYKPYSWNKLQSEYGLSYDQGRDSSILQSSTKRAIAYINNSSSREPEYTAHKPTNSNTSGSSGNTDSNTTHLPSLSIDSAAPNQDLIITLVVEEGIGQETLGKRKKPQTSVQSPKPEEQSQLEPIVNQNPPTPVEVEAIVEQLPTLLQQEEVVQPNPVKELFKVENQQKHKKFPQREEPIKTSQTLVPSHSLEEQPIISLDELALAHSYVSEEGITTESEVSKETEEYPPTQLQQPHLASLTLASTGSLPKEEKIASTLSSVITEYMLAANSPRIRGKELSASQDGDILTVWRHSDDTPVMQTRKSDGKWYEEIPTRLTESEIKQIESLKRYIQQAQVKSQSQARMEL